MVKEQLPSHARHEWVSQIFSTFGTVAYVSLPKFKDQIRIKGFAFVEFTKAESAIKAVQVIPLKTTDKRYRVMDNFC